MGQLIDKFFNLADKHYAGKEQVDAYDRNPPKPKP